MRRCLWNQVNLVTTIATVRPRNRPVDGRRLNQPGRTRETTTEAGRLAAGWRGPDTWWRSDKPARTANLTQSAPPQALVNRKISPPAWREERTAPLFRRRTQLGAICEIFTGVPAAPDPVVSRGVERRHLRLPRGSCDRHRTARHRRSSAPSAGRAASTICSPKPHHRRVPPRAGTVGEIAEPCSGPSAPTNRKQQMV